MFSSASVLCSQPARTYTESFLAPADLDVNVAVRRRHHPLCNPAALKVSCYPLRAAQASRLPGIWVLVTVTNRVPAGHVNWRPTFGEF